MDFYFHIVKWELYAFCYKGIVCLRLGCYDHLIFMLSVFLGLSDYDLFLDTLQVSWIEKQIVHVY